jgi:hypothetical protein
MAKIKRHKLRFAQSKSGAWERRPEAFPQPEGMFANAWDRTCEQPDPPTRESKAAESGDIKPIPQLEFAKYVRELLDSVTVEWKHRFEQQQNAAVYDILSQIIAKTTDIFGRKAMVSESFTPEFPEDKYIVFTIKSALAPSEVIAARAKWNAAIAESAPGCNSFRLLVYPK